LTVTGGAACDRLGFVVAISSDGSTIVAGAPNVNFNTGAVYVFTRSGTTWASETDPATLTVSAGNEGDNFGRSVAISGDGSTIVAGAPFANTDVGAGYVFARGASWGSQSSPAGTLGAVGILNDPDPATDLGSSAAISSDGSTIVLGASGVSFNGDSGSQGGAYVYARPGLSWSSGNDTARLLASDGDVHDLLGTSVAISADGSTIAAGAPSTAKPGAVYVYNKPAIGGWIDNNQNAKLAASDGTNDDNLGSSMVISSDGSTIVAGAFSATVSGNSHRGASYVFDKPTGGWSGNPEAETSKLIAADGAANDQFGFSVASSSDGSTVVSTATAAASGKGVAYEFGAAGTTGSSFPLTVSINPAGDGTVTSQPAGIACPGSCADTYSAGTSVTLTATPASGFTFSGWSGDCASQATAVCTLAMTQARTVTALFSNKAATKLQLSCGYDAAAFSERCQGQVSGGATEPAGQVVFQSSNGAGFPSGNSCTLSSSASCQVSVLPPPADQASVGTVALSATYSGDTTHAPSTATVQFSTSAELNALQGAVNKSCTVSVINPNGGTLTSFAPSVPGTFVASMTTAAADAFGLIPPAPGSSSAVDVMTAEVGSNGTEDTSCVVNPQTAASTDVPARAAKAVKCSSGKSSKGKHCAPATVVIAHLTQKLKGGRRYTLHIPLTSVGRRLFKLQAAMDKTYFKHHHGKHLKPPHLKIRLTISFKPS
jgi:uncharacterized repeat protein (TIGR02543 family)